MRGLFSRVVPACDQERGDERFDGDVGGESVYRVGVVLANCPTLLHREEVSRKDAKNAKIEERKRSLSSDKLQNQ